MNRWGRRDDDDDDPCPPLLDALLYFRSIARSKRHDHAARAGAACGEVLTRPEPPPHSCNVGTRVHYSRTTCRRCGVGAIWNKPQIDDWGNHGDWDLLTPIGATINLTGGHGMRVGRTREFAMLPVPAP